MVKSHLDILEFIAGQHIPDDLDLFPAVFAQVSQRKTFMQTLRARPVLAVLIAVLALLLLTGVAYAVGRSLGYIPGFGLVEQGTSIRVLDEPVSVTRDGITVTVTSAVSTAERTVIEFTVENVPWSALSHNENVGGCSGTATLQLPDGAVLMIKEGSGSAQKTRFVYAPIPSEFNEVSVVLPCILDTLPGKAPEDWEFPLHFVPAPADMATAPVISVPSPASPASDPTGQGATRNSLYNSVLRVDQFIPLEDGYYLLGHTEWADARITNLLPESWVMKAYDSTGQELALEPGDWQESGLSPQSNQWLFKLYGKSFDGPVTLRTSWMYVEFRQPIVFTLNLESQGFDFSDSKLNTSYALDSIPLDMPGIQASATQATYIKQGDLSGFEITIQSDPALQNLSLTMETGLDISGLAGISSSGGSSRDEKTGLVISKALTNARMSFPLELTARSATVIGTWETTWNPPISAGESTPVTLPEACVTLDRWKTAAASPEPLPSNLSQKVLISRGALSPEPSLFLSNLDGSGEEGLVFGQGSLSPDTSKLVYSGSDGNLYLMDLTTKQAVAITSGGNDRTPLWSPDGSQIAFMRYTESGTNIFVMDSNGKDSHPLTQTTDMLTLSGWIPGSNALLYVRAQPGGNEIQEVDADNGVSRTLMTLQSDQNDSVDISPNGQWIAFLDKVHGRMTPGIFVSRLDGSERRLIVQLEYWVVAQPRWSPAGEWLSFGVLDVDQMDSPFKSGIVNVNDCQVIPLTQLNGTIEQWINQ